MNQISDDGLRAAIPGFKAIGIDRYERVGRRLAAPAPRGRDTNFSMNGST